MQTKTTTITVYDYQELTQEAKDVALQAWRAGNEYFFLSDGMDERLHELLGEHGITDTNDTSKAGTRPTQVRYSLSCSQGDGAMFEGAFSWKKYTATIKHSGRYYHYNSKEITLTDEDGEESATEAEELEFDELYVSICKALEKYGYAYITSEDSEEFFIDSCEANDYTFTLAGKMENMTT